MNKYTEEEVKKFINKVGKKYLQKNEFHFQATVIYSRIKTCDIIDFEEKLKAQKNYRKDYMAWNMAEQRKFCKLYHKLLED